MDKIELQTYIDQGLSAGKIADKVGKSLGSVRYWISLHGLETSFAKRKREFSEGTASETKLSITERTCSKCKELKPISEYYTTGKKIYSYCKPCAKKTFKQYDGRAKVKLSCVQYKGGKCEHCSYDRCISALEFHHIDPLMKEFHISDYTHHGKIDMEKIKSELDKCALLCANCHREVHAGLIKL